MSNEFPPPKQYDTFAQSYESIECLPISRIESALIDSALGDCTGLSILDLGGGSGMHARRAVAQANAASVDVVDISKEMLRVGQSTTSPNSDRIRWLEADVSKPLSPTLGLKEGGYDVVMANWVFDHATSEEALTGMWANIVQSLKPGGKFLGVRVLFPESEYITKGKYGVTFTKREEIAGGWKYEIGCLTDPPFSFWSTSMRSTLDLDHEIPKRLGLDQFEVVDYQETELVKSDPGFWEELVRDPSLAVVVARKPEA
ncbi:Ubiquinone/menaquinone biosynthesis C-methyltransferase UbiE [Cladorrhinum samala]|uniref:Ubiquinone/menaquinone biosynthesis C-methyltransferase UbiE n=1 Tax=Cladorrhinum samala TaxID=585594 RepID=A0AAV9I1T9_9PEZI|nr:Ubiquinone/menaquinone biosynthesis C-methyltransferase UbiE [Cladorrhinum samala]